MEDLFEAWQVDLMDNVHSGASLLDEEVPGWFWNIKEELLDMGRGNACICGQVFKDMVKGDYNYSITDGFDYFLEKILPDLDESEPSAFGFDAADLYRNGSLVPYGEQHSFLGEVWIQEIKFRRILAMRNG